MSVLRNVKLVRSLCISKGFKVITFYTIHSFKKKNISFYINPPIQHSVFNKCRYTNLPWSQCTIRCQTSTNTSIEHRANSNLSRNGSKWSNSRQIAGSKFKQRIRSENVPWHGATEHYGQNSVRIATTGTHFILYDKFGWRSITYWQCGWSIEQWLDLCAVSGSWCVGVAWIHNIRVHWPMLRECGRSREGKTDASALWI